MGETPDWPVRNTHYFQPATEEQAAVCGDKAHQTLKTMSGVPDVLFQDK